MDTPTPILPPTFIKALAAGDLHIEKAAKNLNNIVTDFSTSFHAPTVEAPACRILTAQGAPLKAPIQSHLSAARWLLGVRMTEHLLDLIDALLRYRVFNAALDCRAIVEIAAATVYLQEKLKATMDLPSEDALRGALDELHRSIAGGRFDWITARDNAAMLKNLELYRAGEDPELPADQRATSVLTMLRKLDQRVQSRFKAVASGTLSDVQGGVIRAVYAQLSDICHPATGTAILLSERSDRNGWVRMKNTTGERETRWFFWNLGIFIPTVADVALDSLVRMNNLTPNS